MKYKWFTRSQIAVVIASMATFVMGLVSENMADFLPRGIATVIILIILTIFLWGLSLRLTPQRQIIRPVFRAPIILRTPTEKRTHARKGVIVFLSFYRPRRGSSAEGLSSEERLQAAKSQDYKKLDLENSNLWPAIQAITTHAERLEHCWLISTTAADVTRHGSFPYASVLVRYLREIKKVNCNFYGVEDDKYAIPLDDDALVMQKTYKMIDSIFEETEKLDLSETEIVADFTGGFRSMTLGMILACLDGNRDIQFQGVHYDETGSIASDIFPILFDFETEVVDEL